MMEPSAPPPPYKESKYVKINNLLSKYDINPMLSEKMSILEEYEIVLLLDDSGSMNTPLNDHTSHATRWDELKDVIKIIIDISTTYDDNGIDLYFLNRGFRQNIKNYTQIGDLILDPPSGRTPLNQRVLEILRSYSTCNKPLLLVIATDGVPTDSYGNTNIQAFKQTLLNKNHSKVYVSFLACSDNDDDIEYLNDLDKTIPNIDTLDEFDCMDDYCGTIKYAPREILLGDLRLLSVKADIFSFGILIWEIFTEVRPFRNISTDFIQEFSYMDSKEVLKPYSDVDKNGNLIQ